MCFQANLEGSLRGKTEKTKTRGPARKFEGEGSKRRNIAELVGYKNSGGEMVRKVEFKNVQGSAPTISAQFRQSLVSGSNMTTSVVPN